MSGKAPPKGPRALLGTPGGSSAPASSSSSSLSTSLAPTHNMNNVPPQRAQPRAAPPASSLPNNPSSRIGAAPPTGPRSLGFQNSHGRMPPPGPKHSFVNGVHHPASSSGGLQKNRNPISIKGKNRDSGTTVNGSSSSSSSLASSSRPESPTRLGELKQDRPAFHISLNPPSRDSSAVEESSRGYGSSNGLASTSLSSAPPQGELKQDRPAFHMSLHSTARKSSLGEPSTSLLVKPDQPALQIPPHPQPPPPTYDPPPPPPPSESPPPPPISSPPPPPALSPPPPPPAISPPPPPPPLPPVASPPPLPPPISEPPPQPTILPPPPPPPAHQPVSVPQPRPPSPRPPPLPRPNSLPRRPPSPSSWHSRPRSRESSRTARPHPPSPKKSQPPPLPPQPTPPPPPQQQLPPPPEWPPPRSEYPSIRSFKILYDSSIDTASSYKTTRPSYYRALIDHIKKHAKSASVVQERIKVKEKEKATETTLFRYEGEVVGPFESGNDDPEGMKEDELVVKDPRLEPGFRRGKGGRVNEFIEVKYDYDENSVGPPPPASILVTNVSPLTPLHALRRTFATYGTIASFEPQIDTSNGAALGIIFIKYLAHEHAKRAVEKENGRKGGIVGATVLKGSEDEEWKVVFDGEGGKLKMVLKELEERKKREKEERRRAAAPVSATTNGASTSTPSSSNRDRVSTPHSGMDSPLSQQRKPGPPGSSNSNSTTSAPTTAPQAQRILPPPLTHGLPPKPGTIQTPTASSDKPKDPVSEPDPQPQSKVLSTLAEARAKAARDRSAQEKAPTATSMGKSTSSTVRKPYTSRYAYYPLYRPNSPLDDNDKDKDATTTIIGKEKSAEEREKERQELLRELSTNGYEHVQILGGVRLIQSVRDEDVRAFFEGFDVDKILRDHTHLYITFPKPGVAHRATTLLNSNSKLLHFQSVTLSVQPPPEYTPTVVKTSWTPTELVDEAQRIIVHELRVLLERDIGERLVQQDLKRLITEERNKRVSVVGLGGDRPMEKKGLKGLSFKKKAKTQVAMGAQEKEGKEEEEEEEEETEKPPKKKKKTELVVPVPEKKSKRVVDDEDIESEDEDEDNAARVFIEADTVGRKRAVSIDGRDEELENEEPAKKKQKVQEVKVKVKPKKPTATKKSKKALKAETVVEEVVFESDAFQSPFVDQLRLGSSSLTPSSRSPTPVAVLRPSTKRKKRVVTPRPPTPPPDPVGCGLCEDDEDIYFTKLALTGEVPAEEKPQVPPTSTDIPTFRKHLTGSARTEGYYKITHAEKAAYVAQYQARAAASIGGAAPPVVDEPKPQHVTSSRSNRANARRRAQGLEEINQVQRAVALSKGETAANELTFKFNQLQTRKKHLRFARSPIHDWGLYAMEKIARGEMVIEYVGEVIRAQVADKREKAYERQGIGSSYLFRIDEDLVVDATKKGNLGRLINHSCDPNCTAKIITISGEKKIVIYAKQEIELGDEITYDYHFPFEQDKIPCLCGSAKCRGFLN